jgi:hypothetical protein
MSVAGRTQIARRPLLKGLLGTVAVVAAAAAVIEAPKLLAPHYPPSPYDDLLALLPDRPSAVAIGAAWLAGNGHFDAGETARRLRTQLAHQSIATALDADLANAHMGEADGWVLPGTLIALCALAKSG